MEIDPKDWNDATNDAIDQVFHPRWYWLRTTGARVGGVLLALLLLGAIAAWVYSDNYKSCEAAKQAEGYKPDEVSAICRYESERETRRYMKDR